MKTLMRLSLILVLCACVPTFSFSYSKKCDNTSQCPTGNFCTGGACVKPECLQNVDCASGAICESDFTCSKGQGGSALSITALAGDVSSSRIRSSIRITGTGFSTAVTGQLISAALHQTYDLIIHPANAETLDAEVSPTLVQVLNASSASTFTVRLSSKSGGSVTRDVSLLQGEKGDKGDQGQPGTPFSSTLTLADASTPTLTLSNTAANGTALAIAGGGVKLPIQIIAASDSNPGSYTDYAPCPTGWMAIGCACQTVITGVKDRVQWSCITDGSSTCTTGSIGASPSGCYCKFDSAPNNSGFTHASGGGGDQNDHIAFATCLNTGL